MASTGQPEDCFDKSVTPQFLLDLIPAGEKTELLFHISYLCLGKFPQLERILRANAVEAQMVFNSSESLLMQEKTTTENAALRKNVEMVQARLDKANVTMVAKEVELNEAEQTLKTIIQEVASRDRKFGIAAAVVPIFGLLVDAIQKSVNSPNDRASMDTAKITIDRLQKDRVILANEVGRTESDLMHEQFKVTTSALALNAIPDPVHLPEVQANLTRIQKILLQLKSFWEKIRVLVVDLQQKTFAAEDLIELLSDADFKKEFIDSIALAGQAWSSFRIGCSDIVGIFNAKNKDAYKFLEINPSTLTPEEWQKQYRALQEKLDIFYADPAIVGEPPNAAIAK
ncbi:uncharacterized protein FYW47_014473 [Aplochiton taeniatus]